MITINLHIYWWVIPTIVTFVAICWALFGLKSRGYYFSGLNNIFALIPALIISVAFWIVAGFLK
jgi:hypothetical protein